MSEEPLRVYLRDIRAAGMCVDKPTREWFARNNLDWKDFVRNGIDAQAILDCNDALGNQVVEAARGRR